MKASEPALSPALRRVQLRLLELHPGIFQPDDYLARWCGPAIADLFDRYAVRIEPGAHIYVDGVYGPRNCIKNAWHYATVNPGASPWWAFSLYHEAELREYVWWLHSFCLSEDGRTLFDPTTPPEHAPLSPGTAPADSPVIFVGIPWGIELYRELAASPFDPDTLPPFVRRSIFPVLEHYRNVAGL